MAKWIDPYKLKAYDDESYKESVERVREQIDTFNPPPPMSRPRTITPAPLPSSNEVLFNSLLKTPQLSTVSSHAPVLQPKTIGEDFFLVNAFPIRENDNILKKGLKGIGNFAASAFDAPVEAYRKGIIQGSNLLTGKGIQSLPKNTSFTEDILPKGASDVIANFQQKNPILGGLTRMGVETIADPTTFLGGNILKNTAKKAYAPKFEQNFLDPSLIKSAQTTPQAPVSRVTPWARESISQPKQIAQNGLQADPKLKVMAADIEQPRIESSSLSTPKLDATISEPFLKERQFAQNSVLNSQVATDPLKEMVTENMPTYEPITNKETFDKATDIVNTDYSKAVASFDDAKGGVNADDVALGEALITKAIRDGNTDEANRLISDLAEKLTTAGQAVQAASIFKRLTPEGMLLYAQRMINRANRDLFDRLGKKAQNIVLTSDDSQFILDTMKNVQKLPDGRGRDIELAKVMQRISNKVPASLGEKIKGLQRITMLLNPKTMTRNTVGNALFSTIDNVSNVLATPLDIATGKFTGKRTTTLPSITGQLQSMKKGVKETVEDARLGIDTYPAQTQYELPNKRIFDTGILNSLDKATRTGLQLGDRPFFQAAYDDVLRQQMKLAKVSEPTQEMIDQATRIAKERTYQDTNKITQAADGLRDAFNKLGAKNFGAGNIILPFTKTPANILKRAIEYSPVGLTKTIQETVNLVKKNGKFDQKAFVDSISRSATGTGIIMAGYELAQKGILTGSGNKDKDIASFERNLGKSDFAVKLGNTYYTYDWAQPASLALAVGADMFLKGKDKKEAENAVIEGIKSGGETLLKQSFLQGVQRLFGGYAPMDNLEQTAYNAPAQFIPTLSNQITQLIDPQKRSTASDTVQGKALNSMKAKIPGLSQGLEPSVDTFGNPIQQYQGENNPFNIFVNPGRSTTFNPSPIQAEILKVYESTGRKDIFPRVAPKSFTSKGETVTLTPREITQFQTTMGKESERLLEPIVSRTYADEQKAKLMAAALEKAYEKAKEELLKKRK